MKRGDVDFVGYIDDVVCFDAEYDNGNSGTAAYIDWNNGNKQKITLNANTTLTFAMPGESGTTPAANLILKILQDNSGSRTITWPGTVKWPGGTAPTLTTTANAIDIICFYFDSTSYYGSFSTNYS